MKTLTTEISTVRRVARRLEEDIRLRGLATGDRYLTAHQAAEMLGVSPTSAQRALKLLADSNKLLRRRCLGTFVGPQVNAASTPKVRTVYVLAPEELRSVVLERYAGILKVIGEETQCTNINYGFIPEVNGLEYVRYLIESSSAIGKIAGVLALGCPSEVYKFLAESGAPTAIFGSLYHDAPPLPSADVDNREVGRILASYLAAQGHRRMALLAATQGRPGDHAFIDGVNDALTTAGLPANAIVLRITPLEAEACRREVRQLLESPDRPTGLIVRGEHMINAVHAAVIEMQLDVPRQLDIVFELVWADVPEDSLRYPHVAPKLGSEDVARLLGRMLVDLDAGGHAKPNKVVIPVELRNAVESERIERRENQFS